MIMTTTAPINKIKNKNTTLLEQLACITN